MPWFTPPKQELKTTPVLQCSFCGLSQREVVKLIAGPKVYICDQCVKLCVDLVETGPEGEAAWAEARPRVPVPSPPLDALLSSLEQRCVGQVGARTALARALSLHLARLQPDSPASRVPVVLLVGPHGTGKTTLLQALLEATSLPGYLADLSRVSATGYVGLDVENLLQGLVQGAGGDRNLAQCGILALDALHRVARQEPPLGTARDITGEGVQRDLLRVLEGQVTETWNGKARHPQAPSEPFSCARLLVVLAGTFSLPPGLAQDGSDLRGFLADQGILPELLARVDLVVSLSPYTGPELQILLDRHLLPPHQGAAALLGLPPFSPDEARALVARAGDSGVGAWTLRQGLARRLLA